MNKTVATVIVALVFLIFVVGPIVLAITQHVAAFYAAALVGMVSVSIFVFVFRRNWWQMQ